LSASASSSSLAKPTAFAGAPYLGCVSFEAAVLSAENSKLTVYGASDFKTGLSVSSDSVSTGQGGVFGGNVYATGRITANAGDVRVANGSILVKNSNEGKDYDPLVSPGMLGTLGVANESI